MKFFDVHCFKGPCADQLMPCGAWEGNRHAGRERTFGRSELRMRSADKIPISSTRESINVRGGETA